MTKEQFACTFVDIDELETFLNNLEKRSYELVSVHYIKDKRVLVITKTYLQIKPKRKR